MKTFTAFLFGLLLCLGPVFAEKSAAPAPQVQQTPQTPPPQPDPVPPPPPPPVIDSLTQALDALHLIASVRGDNLELDMQFDLIVREKAATEALLILKGAGVLTEWEQTGDSRPVYVGDEKTPGIGRYELPRAFQTAGPVRARFVIQPTSADAQGWRSARVELPLSRIRHLTLNLDSADVRVEVPGALKIERRDAAGSSTVEALLPPTLPLELRWKPQVRVLEGKLVATCTANAIARVSAAALRLDSLFTFDIAQGELTELRFDVPADLQITQVRGVDLRDWKLTDAADGLKKLEVRLTRPHTHRYLLQVTGESVLGPLPLSRPMPVLHPSDGLRTSGHLAVGADGATHLVVQKSAGLSQVDATGFPRLLYQAKEPRALPLRNAFFYTFAASPYELQMKLEDIQPDFDVMHEAVLRLREEDLGIQDRLTLDVRDAPLRELLIHLPPGLNVAAVQGKWVEEYRVEDAEAGQPRRLRVLFSQPVLGRSTLDLMLERGGSPLGTAVPITGLQVPAASHEQGFVVIVADEAVQMDPPEVLNLREAQPASVPLRVPGASFAYRLRDRDWGLTLQATRRPTVIRAEGFHQLSIGQSILYGAVAVSYHIAGAPVDELRFQVPPELGTVEFVGSDVRRWYADPQNPSHQTVKLSRKVIGDYNIALLYSRRFEPSEPIRVGAVQCLDVQTQIGYVVVASPLNLEIEEKAPSTGLLGIGQEEIPSGYRLLTRSPILRTWKYVEAPHETSLNVKLHPHASLLPVIIELTEARSRLAVDQQNNVESVTVLRYKIKNTSAQHLVLDMPAGAKIWSTHQILEGDQGEGRERITATLQPRPDGSGNWLLVPLPRHRNPNDPITIDLEYGQTHGAIGYSGQLVLQAPRSTQVKSTFTHWQVDAPENWSVLPNAARWSVMERSEQPGGSTVVLKMSARAWGWALEKWLGMPMILAFLMAIGALSLVTLLKRPLLGDAALAVVLLMMLALGATAAAAPGFLHILGSNDDLRSLVLARPLDLSADQAQQIGVNLIPEWRQHVSVFGGLIVPLIGLGLLIAGFFIPKFGRLLWPVGTCCVLEGLSRFGVIEIGQTQISIGAFAGHLLTWALPLGALIYLGWRWMGRPFFRLPLRTAATTALLSLALLVQTGCTSPQPIDEPVLQPHRIQVDLEARADHVLARYAIQIRSAAPGRLPLLGTDAVLQTPARPQEGASLEIENGRYWLRFARAGDWNLEMEFLLPLNNRAADQSRFMRLKLPEGLSNQVTLLVPQKDMTLTAPGAAYQKLEEAPDFSRLVTRWLPGTDARFTWSPRSRETRREQQLFYTASTSLFRFDTALVRGEHRFHLQIAQGEIDQVECLIPEGQTVTAVSGSDIGAWRFDPVASKLLVKLVRPTTDSYLLRVTTQSTSDKMPWSTELKVPQVTGSQHQRGTVALASSPAVMITAIKSPSAMDNADFIRLSDTLLREVADVAPADVRSAYRLHQPDEPLQVRVEAMQPELRAEELTSFSVSEERLVLNGQLQVQVAKAGLFSVQLRLPAAYDIDTLSGPNTSHWDEEVQNGVRLVQVHFSQKLMGVEPLKITLSQPLTHLPEQIALPRIEVVGALKHAGQITVSAERGLRLSVTGREGVSERHPGELGVKTAGVMVFKLLRPDWKLQLKTEPIQPRITVQGLHVAQVTDGLVRHTHQFLYTLMHAGTRTFQLRVPADVLGLQIRGPGIANLKQISTDANGALWRIELNEKVYDRPYPLTVQYERPYLLDQGRLQVEAVEPLDVDEFRGHLVVRTAQRVALSVKNADASLQHTEARLIAPLFGGQDLADAAYAYRCIRPLYRLTLDARRHEAAQLLEADVEQLHMISLINETGQSLNHVQLNLRVGTKRHLGLQLPAGSRIWALLVNSQAVEPALAGDAKDPLWLIPLGPGSQESSVAVSLIYAHTPSAHNLARQKYEGPRFDLPLKNLSWEMYVPDGHRYRNFDGSMQVSEETRFGPSLSHYDLDRYEEKQQAVASAKNKLASDLLQQADVWSQQGKAAAAQNARQMAYNYSFNDQALNEDARVQLFANAQSLGMVTLKNRRVLLRGGAEAAAPAAPEPETLTQEQTQRELNELDQADSDNLQRITQRMLQTQEAATEAVLPLEILVAEHGRKLSFHRPLQVQPSSPMTVSFEVEPESRPWSRDVLALAALFGLFSALNLGIPLIAGRLDQSRKIPAEQPVEIIESETPDKIDED